MSIDTIIRSAGHYLAVNGGLIDNNDTGNTKIKRDLEQLYLTGRISDEFITDQPGRAVSRYCDPNTDALEKIDQWARFYRHVLWREHPRRLEVWVKAQALCGVVWEVTGLFGVSLRVIGDCASPLPPKAVEAVTEGGKPTTIYEIGDHDPRGLQIAATEESSLRQAAPKADIEFCRLAVTPEQVAEHGLVTRPVGSSGARAESFVGDIVEVEAIPPNILRALVERAIVRHAGSNAWSRLIEIRAWELREIHELFKDMDKLFW